MAAPASQQQDDSCLVTITYGVLKAGGSGDSEYGIFIIDPALQPTQVGGGNCSVQKTELGMCVLPSWLLVDSHTQLYSLLHSLLMFNCSRSGLVSAQEGVTCMCMHWPNGQMGLGYTSCAWPPCSALPCCAGAAACVGADLAVHQWGNVGRGVCCAAWRR
jgi:hypothetical protein